MVVWQPTPVLENEEIESDAVWKAVWKAIADADVHTVLSILKSNPNIDIDREDSMRTPLIHVIECHRESSYFDAERKTNLLDIMEALLDYGAVARGTPMDFYTPMETVCKCRYLASMLYPEKDIEISGDLVNMLVKYGAPVDGSGVRETPLNDACNCESTPIACANIRLLLNAGADVDGLDVGVSPLHRATLKGNTRAVEILIDAGADVNKGTRIFYEYADGTTALHIAADGDMWWNQGELDAENIHTVNMLLAAGANPNIADTSGRTPLYYAAVRASVEIVTALLDAGCDPWHRDNNGRTVLQWVHHKQQNDDVDVVVDDDDDDDDSDIFKEFPAKFNIITALVAAGDRAWECVPTPCPGLEAALTSVWRTAPDELPEIIKRMENPPQNIVELFPRMDEEMQCVVQEILKVVHRVSLPQLKGHLLNSIFGFTW